MSEKQKPISEELKALETLAEMTRPVFYRGEDCCGDHLFSDCHPAPTHSFKTIEEGVEFFTPRKIKGLPNDQTN